MKKIFFLIAVFFSFAGYAQTVGQLRYDTVKMYKVGGTTELIIQNATKDRTNAAFKNMGNGRGAWENVVDSVFKNATADSFVYYIGGVRRAFKDSIGTGSFARDTIVAGRGLTGTPITATKVQIDNDSGYYAGIIRGDTLVLYRYNGDSTEFTLPSGGGGTGWGLTGNAISSGDFLGTTNNEPLVFKFNGNDRGIISGTNIAFGSFINAGVGNAGFGDDALLSATSSTNYNTATGSIALQVLTSGNNNVAVGYNSLSGITTGVANTAIGAETTLATTSSTDSAIAIGYEAVASTKQLAFSPHVTEIKATGITGASNSGYVLTTNGSGIATFQAAGGGSSLTGNLTYVDAVNGDDGTGTLGDFTKPYLTPLAAFTAATTGYTIVVRPGIYLLGASEGNMLKDSVNWYFMPGAIFVANAANSSSMFSDNSGAINCSVSGYGQFYDTLGGESKILEVSSAGSNIYFECQSITVGDGNIDHGIVQSSGSINAYVRGSITSKSYDAISITGGILNLAADSLIASGALEGNAIEVQGGEVNIKCTGYRSAGAYDAFGGTSAVAWVGGDVTIEGGGVADLSDGMFITQTISGTLNLRGRLKSTSKTAVVYDAGTSNKTFINQATLVSNTSFDSIDAPSAQTVISYGTFANKAVDANITINGILTIGSYVQ